MHSKLRILWPLPQSRSCKQRNSKQRRNPALLAPSHHARGWHGGPAEDQSRPRPLHRRRRPGFPASLFIWPPPESAPSAWVDFDVVDYTNLQRQIIHSTADVGRKKLDSAARQADRINPFLNVRKFDTRLSSDNALELFRDFDIIADGTDNFPTRYLVNDACVLTGKPNVYGSIFASKARPASLPPKMDLATAAYIPNPPPPGLVPSCAEGGVLGILPAWSASCRLPKSSSWCSASAIPSSAACCSSMPWA